MNIISHRQNNILSGINKFLIFFIIGLLSESLGAQIKAEMIFDLQTHHVHSSSIVELPNGDLLTVWFEIMDSGKERTSKNVKLMGARLRKGKDIWTQPFLMAETPYFPDGNPVLFLNSKNKLFLVWDVLQAEVWHAAVLKIRTSIDYSGEGAPVWEWQDNIFLKPGEDFVNEVKVKLQSTNPSSTVDKKVEKETFDSYRKSILSISQDPVLRSIGWMTRLQPIILKKGPHKGRILLPLYNDSLKMSLCAISDDDGTTWTPSLPIVGPGNIQPALLEKNNGDIVAYMRDVSGTYYIHKSYSTNSGNSWSSSQYIDIRNPNSSVEVKALTDGRWVMVCNDMNNFKKTEMGCCDGRQRLVLYTSEDEGEHWTRKLILEDDTQKPNVLEQRGRYHYPTIIQTRDGLLHLVYTYNKRETPYAKGKDNAIKHVVIDPEKL
jgi:predicted neuraminidase